MLKCLQINRVVGYLNFKNSSKELILYFLYPTKWHLDKIFIIHTCLDYTVSLIIELS